MSNRFVLVDREIVSGRIEGVDFGPKLYVIARSPSAVLVWDSGHSYTSGRQTQYGESSMILLPDRTRRFRYHPSWKTIGDNGGRLSVARVALSLKNIEKGFDLNESDALWFMDTVRKKKTLLIEGGGPRLAPYCKLAWAPPDEYKRWRDLPAEDRGFCIGGAS